MILGVFNKYIAFDYVFYATFVSILSTTLYSAFSKNKLSTKWVGAFCLLLAIFAPNIFVLSCAAFIYYFYRFCLPRHPDNNISADESNRVRTAANLKAQLRPRHRTILINRQPEGINLSAEADPIIQMNLVDNEWLILILCVICGALLSIEAKNFLTLFVGIELQNLALILISSQTAEEKVGTEPSIKFFVCNAISAFMMLLGIGLIYLSSGSIYFDTMGYNSTNYYHIAGTASIIASLLFKLGLFPFNEWLLDVCTGLKPVGLASLNIIPKLTAFIVFIKVVSISMPYHSHWLSDIMALLGVLSMLIASLGGVGQKNLNRLIIYSSIYNAAFVVLLSAYVPVNFALKYAMGYVLTTSLLFAARIFCSGNLDKLVFTNKTARLAMLISVISLASLPPMPVFFLKLNVIQALIEKSMWAAAFALVTSAINLFFYIRLAKRIFEAETVEENYSKLLVLIIILFLVSIYLLSNFSLLDSKYMFSFA